MKHFLLTIGALALLTACTPPASEQTPPLPAGNNGITIEDGSLPGMPSPPANPPQEDEEITYCTQDVKECPNGSFVGREGPDCEFAKCPSEDLLQPTPEDTPVACAQDAKICPDGSSVGRTGPNCEFAACPDEDEEEPIEDETNPAEAVDEGGDESDAAPAAEDGVVEAEASGIVETEIEAALVQTFEIVPDAGDPQGPFGCNNDAKVCEDGTTYSRVGPSCSFPECPPQE